ncbi:hypothetical protein TUBRATIS_004790 [Tubulinosema ratisbonensis]|uniref:Uncharacterized protein n=1 Tax=Tubulinosema ratisbonensis TaxID=291195 RepID=A0A437APR2_9MICR|nr:hypothetical protein TUBRATIS_004790 [Tubulinosema ratisbonensis]
MKNTLNTILIILLGLALGIILILGIKKLTDRRKLHRNNIDEKSAIEARRNIIQEIQQEINTIENQLSTNKKIDKLKEFKMISDKYFMKKDGTMFVPSDYYLILNFSDKDVSINNSFLGSFMIDFLRINGITEDFVQFYKKSFYMSKHKISISGVKFNDIYITFVAFPNKDEFLNLNKSIENYEKDLNTFFADFLNLVLKNYKSKTLFLRESIFEKIAFLSKDSNGILFSRKELELRMKRSFLEAILHFSSQSISIVFYEE